jgi:hypothetical protein
MKGRGIVFVLAIVFVFCGRNVVKADTVEVHKPLFEGMHVGLCFKKFNGFYWCNGITLVINESMFNAPVAYGVNFTTSYLGSAMLNDALPLNIFEMFAQYRFNSKKNFQPFAGILFGGAFSNYKDPAFKHLQQAQTIFSPEFGLSYHLKIPVNVSASFGYNLITGDGKRGLGLVYPLFGQIKIAYRL